MSDKPDMKKAMSVYKHILKALDDRKWHYNSDESEMTVRFTVHGEDIPMDFLCFVDAEREVVRLLSFLPFAFPEDKRVLGAVATCQATYQLIDGSFDYEISSGRIAFRMTTSYRESLLSAEVFNYLIHCACSTVDYFNDKLLMLAKGTISIEQFLSDID